MDGDNVLDYLMTNCFVAQKRTGTNKQFVFYHNDEVYKGPYSRDKMNLILDRSKQMMIWNTPLIVHSADTKGDFIIYGNIAEDYDIVNYEVNKESFSHYTYKVAERVGVYKMNQVLTKDSWIYDYRDSINLLETLVHLWILEVGDTGIFNILVDVKETDVYVIDYDEKCNEIRRDHLFYFSKHPAKKFMWYENMQKYYLTVAERLKKLVYENTNKVNEAINLLLKYSDLDLKSKLSLGFTMEDLENVKHGNQKLEISFDMGKMEWHGLLGGTITYSGFKLDEVKSGLQKYVRRGIKDKALQCAFELYRLMEITDNFGVLTNLYNRLKIIAVEDIGLAGHNTVLEVLRLINEEIREPSVLAAIVESLVRSKKTRISSHANAVYRNPMGRKYARKQGIEVDRGITDDDSLYINDIKNEYPFCDIYDESMQECAIMLYKRIQESDLNAIAWFANYEKCMIDRVKIRYAYKGKKTTNSIVHIFEVLELLTDNEAIEIIRKAYFTIGSNKRDDKKYFIIFAILFTIYELEYRPKTLKYSADVEDLLAGKYKLELDEYVYDKHTSKGSHKGRDVFVNEGAHVENEDMHYHIQELVDVYMNYL